MVKTALLETKTLLASSRAVREEARRQPSPRPPCPLFSWSGALRSIRCFADFQVRWVHGLTVLGNFSRQQSELINCLQVLLNTTNAMEQFNSLLVGGTRWRQPGALV
jgi:hypothetical protein